MFRRIFQRLLNHELGVIGGEIDRIEARADDLQTQALSLAARFEKLQNRVGMRLTRAERAEGGGASDTELLRDLRDRGTTAGANDRGPWDDFFETPRGRH